MLKRTAFVFTSLTLLILISNSVAAAPFNASVFKSDSVVQQWDIFELELTGPSTGNPFVDVTLTAEFTNGTKIYRPEGFYDGNGVYKIRFMPDELGIWSYTTISNAGELNGRTGNFECVAPSPENHGPVRVRNTYYLAYEDGTPYFSVGTTCYAWVHQGDQLEEQTLETLKTSPFNKIRMCVFPKDYVYNKNEPVYYPYEGTPLKNWDFKRFNPVFWHHFEQRVGQLRDLGIEADIIIFHPYDRWNFSHMGHENNLFYLRYLVARLAAFRNVWWSLANEYDFLNWPMGDWDEYFQFIRDKDPYNHLRGIHNGSKWYDHTKEWVTHASLQTSNMAAGIRYRQQFQKPVIYDECKYEGDIPQGWGHLTARQMMQRFWLGAMGGCYVGHGETYKHPQDILWWSKGGVLRGQSPPRIAFFKEFMMSGPPFEELQQLGDDRGHYILGIPGKYYLVYFDVPKTITVGLAGNQPYKIDAIDPWEMKETPQGTARPGQYTFSAPRADMLYRFITGQYVKQWDVFELELLGPATGNPFKDVTLTGYFTHGDSTIEMSGFYDDYGIYRIRFMPQEQGSWTYVTSSNVAELDSVTGSFLVTAPSPGNHGPVRVVDRHHFAYADGKKFFPVGTTLYCWELERYDETLTTLSNSAINKVRFMPFPHRGNQLPMYPFKGAPNNWDFSQPNPAFWQRIDRSITDLGKLGIEADFIFFHPYDRGQWGLDKMSKEEKEFYLRYVTARLAAYHNVWWSMANEYDAINSSPSYWDPLAQVVADADPFEHMHSIHGYPNTEYPWGSRAWCTHVGIQTPTVTKISSLMSRHGKPIIVDEYQYEGNINPWGNLSGFEETRRHWTATIRGGYATHGESYSPYNFFWKGGTPQGDSFARVSWLSEEVLNNDSKPLPGGLVNINSVSAHVGEDYYLYYYGSSLTSGKTYSMPSGKQYYVDILDTWNMTVTEKGIYSDTFTISWPQSQYIAVRIYDTDLVSAIEEPGKEKGSEKQLPSEFSLSANYPNPFNPKTVISYTLPEMVHVSLEVFNIEGRKVATLVEGFKPAGKYEAVFHGPNLASGIYFYRLRAGSYQAQKKMLLLK